MALLYTGIYEYLKVEEYLFQYDDLEEDNNLWYQVS